MATYNGASYLAEQLESIKAQTHLPLQLVIQDDGSTDRTIEIAEKFATQAPFAVNIDRNPHRLGYIRNFRKAASACNGELIAFCDQDDRWSAEKLERCVSAFTDPQLLMVYHNASIVDERRRKLGQLYEPRAEEQALALMPVPPWHFSLGLVQVFRAQLRQYDDLWDLSVGHLPTLDIVAHDRWYFFLALVLGQVRFLEEELVEYRQHSSNSFGSRQMRPTIEKRWLARLKHHGSQDLRFANAAESRAHILRLLQQRLPGPIPRLSQISQHYETLAERSHRRFHTYSASSLAARMRNLMHSWHRGDYSGWPWGFDRRAVLRDFWSGVLIGNV